MNDKNHDGVAALTPKMLDAVQQAVIDTLGEWTTPEEEAEALAVIMYSLAAVCSGFITSSTPEGGDFMKTLMLFKEILDKQVSEIDIQKHGQAVKA